MSWSESSGRPGCIGGCWRGCECLCWFCCLRQSWRQSRRIGWNHSVSNGGQGCMGFGRRHDFAGSWRRRIGICWSRRESCCRCVRRYHGRQIGRGQARFRSSGTCWRFPRDHRFSGQDSHLRSFGRPGFDRGKRKCDLWTAQIAGRNDQGQHYISETSASTHTQLRPKPGFPHTRYISIIAIRQSFAERL